MAKSDNKQALERGHTLSRYRVLKVLGVGGFGITYLGEDVRDRELVAIKEYLPSEFAVRDAHLVLPKSSDDQEAFEWGLDRFTNEAETLSRFRHKNIIQVLDYFETNNTAYIAMQYENGRPLDALLAEQGPFSELALTGFLFPMADGLRAVHDAGFLHRDIKPANVYIRSADESPVLLDFGSARQALGWRSRTMTAIVSSGYSPPEQYESEGSQGPWSDIYALAATCYEAITGEKPVGALRRLGLALSEKTDPLPRLYGIAPNEYSLQLLQVLDWGLRLDVRERPGSVPEWLAGILGAETEHVNTVLGQDPALQNARSGTTLSDSVYRIGRGRNADVRIDRQGVSREHAEVEALADGSGLHRVTDVGSTNGTFVRRDGHWERIEQELVAGDEPLRIGDFHTNAADLVDMASGHVGHEVGDAPEPIHAAVRVSDRSFGQPGGVRVRRNPSTGEVYGE